MIGKLLLIMLITVQIIDISGFIPHLKRWIWKWLKGKDKPFKDFPLPPLDCSYCMNWWVSLIFLICTGHFTLEYLTIVLLFSWITPYIKDIQYMVGDMISTIINKIDEALGR